MLGVSHHTICYFFFTTFLLVGITYTHQKKFLAKKNLEAKATLTEPKDEINLEQPDVKEVSAETEVNSVGEYVYDTKLDCAIH